MSEVQDSSAWSWSPPIFDTKKDPELLSSTSCDVIEDFYRGGRWSPDGSSVLSTTEMRTCQVFVMPSTAPPTALQSRLRVPQPSPILDAIWYPGATYSDPASYCFVASVRDSPVKLLDAASGRLRASYKIIDHRERFIAPHSMAFDQSMSKLYCGCEDFVEVFDLHRPGEGTRHPTTPSKKSKDGLKGIISALAFPPAYSSYASTFAVGAYSSSPYPLALFSAESPSASPIMYLEGARPGGITQVLFHPTHEHSIFAASRRSNAIHEWDMRNPTGAIREYDRGGKGTNQRMRFDIDLGGKWLAAGNEVGDVHLFDLSSEYPSHLHESAPSLVNPHLLFRAHQDTIGSVSFHAVHPYLLSVSGARQFNDSVELSSSSSESSESKPDVVEESNPPNGTIASRRGKKLLSRPVAHDTTIKIWNFASHEGTGISVDSQDTNI